MSQDTRKVRFGLLPVAATVAARAKRIRIASGGCHMCFKMGIKTLVLFIRS